jgi:hypothetical protein
LNHLATPSQKNNRETGESIMADKVTIKEIDLGTFLQSAGQSFTDAQKRLVPDLSSQVNMILSNAELEVKVTVSSDSRGNMSVRPVSSDDIASGNINPGMLSTLRMSFVSSIGEFASRTPVDTNPEGITKTDMVPSITGMRLNEATAFLKATGWQFEAHAASENETGAADKGQLGKVVRQIPAASEHADKSKVAIQFWVDLGNTPVREIESIGDKLENALAKINITTIGELSLAKAPVIASAIRISESRAQGIIDMAALMSQLVISGFKEQVVELLVEGSKITSVKQLSNAIPEELYNACQNAVKSGKVKVPRGFKFTMDDVKAWINHASACL